jgi:hypothetical protein
LAFVEQQQGRTWFDRTGIQNRRLRLATIRLGTDWSLYLASFDPGLLKVGVTQNLHQRVKGLLSYAKFQKRQVARPVLIRAVEVGDYWDARTYEDAIVARCRPFTMAMDHNRSEWFEDRPFVRELFHLVASEIDP